MALKSLEGRKEGKDFKRKVKSKESNKGFDMRYYLGFRLIGASLIRSRLKRLFDSLTSTVKYKYN